MTKFENMVYLNFSNKEILKKQQDAIKKVRAQFGREYPNIVNGKEVKTQKKTISINPANTDEVVGTFQKGGKDDAEQAIQAALKAFETWQYVPAKERANYLFKAAKVMNKRRYEINAWMVS